MNMPRTAERTIAPQTALSGSTQARKHTPAVVARKGKTPYQIAMEMGIIGMDKDPRKNVAQDHSRFLKLALRRKQSSEN